MKNEERLSGALHQVYYLFDEANLLVYIGRSSKPKWRRWVFERRTGIRVTLGLCQKHRTLEAACIAERKAIQKWSPPFNLKVSSTRGMTGKTHAESTRRRIGAAHVGKILSDATKAKISVARKGKPGTNKGRKFSAEARANMKFGAQQREQHKKEIARGN